MLKMSFDVNRVSLILICISTVTYSVSVNGRLGEFLRPKRGLKQGDPLSPFLFLLCREGLSTLMNMAVQKVSTAGVKASRRGPVVSHLFFADDCVLFTEASDKGVLAIKNILKEYGLLASMCQLRKVNCLL